MGAQSQNGSHESFKQAQVAVLMVPFPAHSHLNQLLHLSCLISSSYNISVHYAAFAAHNRQVKLRLSAGNRLKTATVQFHDLPSTPFPSPSPNPNSTNFLAHLQPSFDATLELRRPVAALLREIATSARRVVVVHDALMAYAVQDTETVPNAESYVFNPTSAFSSFFDTWDMMGKPSPVEGPKNLPSMEGCHSSEILNFIGLQCSFLNMKNGTIINSCRSIEGVYIDLLGNNGERKIWAVGPLNSTRSNDKHKCLEWLDKHDPRSVIYVSFGTTTCLADEQINELASGLEQSQQKFIWVLRNADKGDFGEDNRAHLPEGFEERVRETGLVVREWVPQSDILSHPSTAGFMGHCGWSSCLESITMGVPIAAWPMHSDQPKNACLVTEVLKIGLTVRDWARREELVSSSTIAEVVKRLMGSEDGEEMRKRAEELGGAARKAVAEGGASRKELDSFIAHITR